jgi:hypothetical protein
MESKIEGGAYLMIDEVKDNEFKLKTVTDKIEETQKKSGYPYTFFSQKLKESELTEKSTEESREESTAAPAKMDNYIDGVMTMLLHAVEVKCMSYKSLKGFIFIVDVGKDALKNVRKELQFFTASRKCIGTNDTDCIEANNNNVPISKFLLKLTFLKKENEKGSLNLPGLSAKLNEFENQGLFDDIKNQRKIRKQKDLVETFKQEAQLQQTLFKKEFLNDPVTYGILAACQIESVDSMYLLHLLRSKANDPLTYQVIQAMVESRECKCPIGVIAMEYGENYEVLSEHVKLKTIVNSKKCEEKNLKIRLLKLKANIFFKILLMLDAFNNYTNPVLHVDLHQNNIMVFKNVLNSDCTLKPNIYNIMNTSNNTNSYLRGNIEFKPFTYVIDYGRVIELNIDNINFDYLHSNRETQSAETQATETQTQSSKSRNSKKNTTCTIHSRPSDILKTKKNIIQIINIILKEEFNYYKKNFGISFIQSLHLYEDLIYASVFGDNKKNIYDNNGGFVGFGENDFTNGFNKFCEYVNDLIYYYFVLQKDNSVHVNPNQLYNGVTYPLTRKDLNPEIGRIKDRDGMILYDKPGDRTLNHFDLTTYASPGPHFPDSKKIHNEYEEIIKSIPDDKKEELIQKLRQALLTDNYDGIHLPDVDTTRQ